MQMPAKNRGKSAAASDQINLLNVNADSVLLAPPSSQPLSLSSVSPLKIESVVPRRAQNPSSRFLQRSYSTLNLRYLNTLVGENQRKNGIDRSIKKHTNPLRNGNRVVDNAKRTHENGIQISPPSPSRLSPAAAAAQAPAQQQPPSSPSNSAAAGNAQHCGFWRIQRTTKEKEKFPDRINLDRRGLATLPLIVDEPNLRLLSLQHNLINSICVPAAGASVSNNHVENQRDNSSLITAVEFAKKSDHHNQSGSKSAKVSSTTNGGGRQHRLLRTQSIQKPSSSSSSSRTLSRNFSINSAIGRNRLTTTKTIDPNHQNATFNATAAAALINSNETGGVSATIPKSSLVPKSALLHSKEKYVLKKANSFVSSYSKHLGRLIQNRNNGAATANAKLALGSSFSSDSTQDIEIQPPIEMLMIKNDPFNGFAQCLQNLVFLDLTDNQIERISCLDGLTSLTVLLLGKNRINDISGVVSVKATLRVLDLHGNKITTIAQKICQLHELKSLNLAANNLRQIHEDDFKGLAQLKELNIKRNRIKKLNGFNDLHSLERLWMCHNDIEKVCHLWCVKKAINLREITIENNPVSLAGDCISFLVSHLKRLSTFNKMTVTEQVRRAATDWRKNRELYDSNHSELSSDIRREEIISNARTNWELLRSQQPQKCLNYNQKPINGTRTTTSIAAAAAAATSTAAAAAAAALNDADVESNLSNLSENVIIDRKVIRHKTQMIRKNLRKSIKMKRSVSQDNASTHIANEFRLPPIAATIVTDTNVIADSLNASTSSIGVNVDSASSHFISETEELAKSCEELAQIATLDNGTNENQSKNNGIAIEINTNGEIFDQNDNGSESDGVVPAKTHGNGADNSPQQSDKATSSPNSSLNSEKDEAITKVDGGERSVANVPLEKPAVLQRTKSMVKRSCHHPMLQRSQTARVINLISPVPTTTTAAAAAAATSMSSTATASVVAAQTPKPKQLDREREQGGDYLIEICGRYLNVYGSGAIKFIDRQWNAQKANDVHTLKFSYANFNNVATIFGKIKNRFPNAQHFAFQETNIQFLGQLNALAELQGLTSVTVDSEGNPICSKDWRSYVVYRLAHWGIKMINDIEVKKEEIDAAQMKYAGLSELVLWSLPESTIEPLLSRLHLDESCSTAAEKIKPKQWLMGADLSLRSVVGKEALQCKLNASHQFVQENEIRNRGRQCLAEMIENTCNAVEKLQKLETMWSAILLDLIKSTLLDYAQMDSYIESIMTELNSNTNTK